MHQRKGPLSLLLLFFILLIAHTQASAQVEPDTVKRKRELPTGPPGQQPPQQVPPRTQPPVTPPVQAQQEPVLRERPSIMERLYWGGGFGLQFGSFTNVSVSPILGVMVTDKFWSGVGVIYQYSGGRGISYQDYGGKVFAQLELLNLEESFLRGRIVGHTEYDILNIEYGDPTNGKMRSVEGFPLAGLAYRQPMGRRATADLYFLYNFSDSPLNPYSNPVIRFGINIPFRK